MAKKSSAYRLRIDEELHQQFLAACRGEDRPAAQVLREFMREFVAEHQSHKQQTLLKTSLAQHDGARFIKQQQADLRNVL